MVREQPNYGSNHVRETDQIVVSSFCLLVSLVKPMSVTLVRIDSNPYQDKNGFIWVDTMEVRKLGKNYWFPKHKFSLKDVGILPASGNKLDEKAVWNDARCLLTTDMQELPEDKFGVDLLDPAQKEILLKATR